MGYGHFHSQKKQGRNNAGGVLLLLTGSGSSGGPPVDLRGGGEGDRSHGHDFPKQSAGVEHAAPYLSRGRDRPRPTLPVIRPGWRWEDPDLTAPALRSEGKTEVCDAPSSLSSSTSCQTRRWANKGTRNYC